MRYTLVRGESVAGYAKLFSSIVDSTIWRESMATKVVWITLLAKADKEGIIQASIPGLADAARVTLQECVEALEALKAPDEWSRTKDFNGKRILEIEGGWVLLNYLKYRKIKDEEEIREKTRERVKKFRSTHVTNVTLGNAPKHDETQSNDIAEAEAEAEAEARKEKDSSPPAPVHHLPKKEKKIKTTYLKPESEEAWAAVRECTPRTHRRWDEMTRDWVEDPIDMGSIKQGQECFQAIVDAKAASPRDLYASWFAYVTEEDKVTKGFVQRYSTFFGPGKATWIQWLDRGRQLLEAS